MVFAPCTLVARHFNIVFPGWWNKHLHTMEQVATGMCEQFQHVIQLGRITSSFLQDGQEMMDSISPIWRTQCRFTGLHPVPIALQRIDFAIMGQQPHRLCQRPGGKGVSAVALVKDGEGAHIAGICQVKIKAGQLAGSQKPFVDNGCARKRDDVAIMNLRLL